MKKYIYLILVILMSCKKENLDIPQTIYPLPYLPIYPGSSWKYVNEEGDTITHSTAPEYRLVSYQSAVGMIDSVYVPIWNGSAVYGYSYPSNYSSYSNHSGSLNHTGILSEQKGQRWNTSTSLYYTTYRCVMTVDTTITVNSVVFQNVIVVWDYSPFGFCSVASYYAKDVGLIKRNQYDKLTQELVKHIDIVSYHINR